MYDPFASSADAPNSAATHWRYITPSDTTDLDTAPKAIVVVDGGDVTMIGMGAPANAAGVLWPDLPAYASLSIRPRRILATGTTATKILALY